MPRETPSKDERWHRTEDGVYHTGYFTRRVHNTVGVKRTDLCGGIRRGAQEDLRIIAEPMAALISEALDFGIVGHVVVEVGVRIAVEPFPPEDHAYEEVDPDDDPAADPA